MANTNLGRLEKVDLRKIWKNEASDFTPWLASEDNLKILGETIDIELEQEAQEKEVGPYRADILCRDVSNDSWVLIENQLEKTNHTHLGQILTYAAGLNAVMIIWIASQFTDEHKATLEWLNDSTGDDLNFFGLEIELWKIGDSTIAPKFNVAVRPNEWTKGRSAGGSTKRAPSASRLALQGFWEGFREYAQSHAKRFKPGKAKPSNYMQMAFGRKGFRLNAVAAYQYLRPDTGGQGLRVVLRMKGVKATENFQALLAKKQEIEAVLGTELVWDDEKSTRQRIILYEDADISSPENYPAAYAWLAENLDRFHGVFTPYIEEL